MFKHRKKRKKNRKLVDDILRAFRQLGFRPSDPKRKTKVTNNEVHWLNFYLKGTYRVSLRNSSLFSANFLRAVGQQLGISRIEEGGQAPMKYLKKSVALRQIIKEKTIRNAPVRKNRQILIALPDDLVMQLSSLRS